MRKQGFQTIQYGVPIDIYNMIKEKADNYEMTVAAYSRMVTILSTKCNIDLRVKEFPVSDQKNKIIQFQVSKETGNLINEKAQKSILNVPTYVRLITVLADVNIKINNK